MKRYWMIFTAALITVPLVSAPAAKSDDFTASVLKWRSERVERLKAPEGWLSLVGLHWLEAGSSKFGSARSNEILLPSGPSVAGSFEVNGKTVTLVPREGVTIDGKPAARMVMATDASGKPTIARVGSITMQIIERSGRLAVRIKDAEAPTRKNFLGLDYFPVDPKSRVEARFIPYKPAKKIKILNVVGMVEDMVSPGALEFTYGGKTQRLDPVLEEGEADLFLIFGDATNGKTTYGPGRYVYAPMPDANGKTYIDFNRSYNPPCSFTRYATCPLPPKQNRLTVEVNAGEKKYRGGH